MVLGVKLPGVKTRFVYIKSGNLTPDTMYKGGFFQSIKQFETNPRGFIYMLYMLSCTPEDPLLTEKATR